MKALGLRRISVDVSMSLARQFLAGLLQLFIILIIAHALGPEGAGSYSVAMLLPILFSQLLNLGIAAANVYFIASRQVEELEAWAISRNLTLVMSAAGLIFGGAIIILAGRYLFPGIAQEVLLTALVIFPLSLLNVVVSSFFQARQDFRTYNILILVQPGVALGFVLAIWWLSEIGLPIVIGATALSYCVANAIGLWVLNRKIPLLTRVPNGSYLRRALNYGLKTQAGNLVAFLNYRLDLFLVNLIAGPAAAGIYMVAIRLVEQLWMISKAVSTVILPKLSALAGEESTRSALTPLLARLTLWTTFIAACFLAIIAKPAVIVLFGLPFADAVPVVLLLLPGTVLLSCSRVLANDLSARGMVGTNLHLTLFMLVVNTIANLLLIPGFGAAGAAVASSIAYCLDLFLRLILRLHVRTEHWWHNVLPIKEDFHRLRRALKQRTDP